MKKRKKYRDVYRRNRGKKKRRKISFLGKVPGKRKIRKMTETELRHKEKRCYGTNEWTSNKICTPCVWHEDCGKVKPKLLWG